MQRKEGREANTANPGQYWPKNKPTTRSASGAYKREHNPTPGSLADTLVLGSHETRNKNACQKGIYNYHRQTEGCIGR